MRNRIGSEREALLESRLQAAREPKIPPEGGTPTRSCATELASSESSSLEPRLQAARQTRFLAWFKFERWRVASCGWLGSSWQCGQAPGDKPRTGGVDLRSADPSHPALLPAFEPGPIFHVYSNAGKPSRARMQRARGADRPDGSERIQLYERIKCPASDYSGDTAKALHCQRDNSKTGGVPINQPTGLKYRCRNRMDRLLGRCAV